MVRNLKNGAEMEVMPSAEETAWNRKRAATKLNISYKACSIRSGSTISVRQAG